MEAIIPIQLTCLNCGYTALSGDLRVGVEKISKKVSMLLVCELCDSQTTLKFNPLAVIEAYRNAGRDN